MKESTFVSFVIFIPEEKGTESSFISKLDRFAHKRFEHYEIILVQNENNKKPSINPAQRLKSLKSNVTVISVRRKQRGAQGIIAGLERAMGDWIFELDLATADYPLFFLEKLYREAVGRFDIVSACPKLHSTWARRVRKFLFNWVGGSGQSKRPETVRIVSRRALNALLNLEEVHRPRQVLYEQIGYSYKCLEYERWKPIPLFHVKQLRSQMNLITDNWLTAASLISNIAFLSSLFFAVFFIASLGYGLAQLWLQGKLVGLVWLVAILFLGFSLLFLCLGLINEKLTFPRKEPPYLIRSIKVNKAGEQLYPLFPKGEEHK